MWLYVIFVMGLAIGGSLLVIAALSTHRRHGRYRSVLNAWRASPPQERHAAIEPFMSGPDRAVAWYLTGVSWLQDGQTQQAAKAFGMAHHADWQLESAAMLTFTCLKTRGDDGEAFLQILSTTWHEMKRPVIGGRKAEQLVLNGMHDGAMPAELSVIGRLAWQVGPPGVRIALERLMKSSTSGDSWEDVFQPTRD